jgi:plasmid stabilization system protein ParE
MRIVWAKSALGELQRIYEYIYNKSPQNADRIIDEIAQKVTALENYPERYQLDVYKYHNTGSYRAFEHKKIRISYKINTDKIEIVRVKHTKQKPQEY